MDQLEAGIHFLKDISWDDVFGFWRDAEATRPEWIQLYTERGFANWEAWRAHHINPLRLPERTWRLYSIEDPLSVVPSFWAGPHKSWIRRHYAGRSTMLFRELATLPAIKKNEKINQLITDFPESTTIIGLQTDEGVVIVEGMHRCCAVSVVAAEGRRLEGEMRLALADARGEKLPIVSAGTAH